MLYFSYFASVCNNVAPWSDMRKSSKITRSRHSFEYLQFMNNNKRVRWIHVSLFREEKRSCFNFFLTHTTISTSFPYIFFRIPTKELNFWLQLENKLRSKSLWNVLKLQKLFEKGLHVHYLFITNFLFLLLK